MKTTLFDSHCFLRSLPLVLAIATICVRDGDCFSPQNCYAAALCGIGNSRSRNISRNPSSLSAGRDSNMKEWVSYLEDEFNRSGDNNSDNGDENNHRDKDALRSPEAQPPRPFQSSVTTYTNAIEFLDRIENAIPNDLTVVMFFAHYCKTCQRAIVPFKQLANDDSLEGVRFVRFETSALTPKQFTSLGIDRVPFLQIYRNGICVASFSATEKTSRTSRKIVLKPRVLSQIDACQSHSLSDWSAFRNRFDAEIEANKAARKNIRETIGAQNTSNDNGNDNDNDSEEERLYRSVQTLTSESDLLRLLEENQEGGVDNSFVVIMYHSHFDPSCNRAQQKFRKIASERQQQQQRSEGDTPKASYRMARIEASVLSDKALLQLGIKRYPHIQIYWNLSDFHNNERNTKSKECVASFSIPRSFLFARMVNESLDAVDQRTSKEWIEFYNQHQQDIESQQLALEGIVQKQDQQPF